jgi:PEP-CTERM motif-containing protein
MKRILGTVVALAAMLAFGSVGNASSITFDISGGNGSVDTISSFAPAPPGYFIAPLSAGSNVVIDVTGSAVSLTSATINVIGTTTLGFLGTISTNVVATYTGGTGTLSGDTILWSTPTTLAATGTFQCGGGLCGLLSLTEGVDYPIALLGTLLGTTSLTSIDLGTWFLNATHDHINTSTREVIALGGASPPPGPGLPSQWYQLGVPEPTTIGLVLMGLAGIALRSRKA